MNRRVLCVDDEENVLRAFERNLRSQFDVETAVGPARGLEAVKERGPYAAVVSDLRMPEMDGIRFLSAVRGIAPETVRLILSGNADFEAVIASVNEQGIFRLLTKPCPQDKLRTAIEAALKQYRLVTAERELLEVTLIGTIGMMTEVLAAVSPPAFDASARIRRSVLHMATRMGLPDLWEFDAAAMLSRIGCVSIPSDILVSHLAGEILPAEEQEMFASHPLAGHKLLAAIPRLEEVAEIVRYQLTPFREVRAMNVPEPVATGAQMLMVAHQFDLLVSRGAPADSALGHMADHPDIYQPDLVYAMETIDAVSPMEILTARLRDLRPGMMMNQDLRTANGLLLVASGQILSRPVIATLLNSHLGAWYGFFSVRVPAARPSMAETGVIASVSKGAQ